MDAYQIAAPAADVNDTIELIKNYLELAEKRTFAGTMEEHLYHFFGGERFHDYTLDYQGLCVNLLQALAKPKVAAPLREAMGLEYDDVVNLIGRLYYFVNMMNNDQFRARMEIYELDEQGENVARLETTRERYAGLIAGLQRGEKLKDLIKNS